VHEAESFGPGAVRVEPLPDPLRASAEDPRLLIAHAQAVLPASPVPGIAERRAEVPGEPGEPRRSGPRTGVPMEPNPAGGSLYTEVRADVDARRAEVLASLGVV